MSEPEQRTSKERWTLVTEGREYAAHLKSEGVAGYTVVEDLSSRVERLQQRAAELEMPWAQLAKKAEREEGVDTQTFITRLWKKVEDQRRELARYESGRVALCAELDGKRKRVAELERNRDLLESSLKAFVARAARGSELPSAPASKNLLCARLREAATYGTFEPSDMRRAADEIERLQRENIALRNLAENLRPGPISVALGGAEHEAPYRAAVPPFAPLTDDEIADIGSKIDHVKWLTDLLNDDDWNNTEQGLLQFARAIEAHCRATVTKNSPESFEQWRDKTAAEIAMETSPETRDCPHCEDIDFDGEIVHSENCPTRQAHETEASQARRDAEHWRLLTEAYTDSSGIDAGCAIRLVRARLATKSATTTRCECREYIGSDLKLEQHCPVHGQLATR